MEGFQRILLSVHLAMGRIQRGEEGVEAGSRLPTWTQGTLPDYKPCERKGHRFFPRFGSGLISNVILPPMLVHLLNEEAGWELGKIMNSVPALKLYDLG